MREGKLILFYLDTHLIVNDEGNIV